MWDLFHENDVQDVAAAAPADAGNEELNIGFTELAKRQVKTPALFTPGDQPTLAQWFASERVQGG